MVVGLDLDNVGEEIAPLESEVLNDQVELVVGVFNAGDRNIANLVDEFGMDVLAYIRPYLRLELEGALLVVVMVLGETRPVLTEALVERIFTEGDEPGLNLVEQSVLMTLVLLVEEDTTSINQAV
jgi:hypothetical protein